MAKTKITPAKRTKEPTPTLVATAPEIQLRDLRLFRSTCALGSMPLKQLKQQITLQMEPRPSDSEGIIVKATFALSGQTADGAEGPHIEATFAALYSVVGRDAFTPEQVGEFLPAVALNNIIPYWREFVQSTTARMGLPALRIPLMRIGQLSGKVTVEQNAQETASGKKPVDATPKPRRKSSSQ